MKKLAILAVILSLTFVFLQGASAEPKGTLVVGVTTEAPNMDPLAVWITEAMVMMRQIYDTLVDFGPDGEINPRLAESWKRLDDKTWRFHLRKGVKFHNGNPFTAADVKFSIERLMDPKNKAAYFHYFANFEGLTLVDDHTVDLKTKIPEPLLLNHLAFFGRIVSKKFAEEKGIEALRTSAVGTGPFKFVSWVRNDRLTLEANTDWYLEPPKVKTLIFRIIPEMGARIAELQAGGVQIISAVPFFMATQLKKSEGIEVASRLGNRAYYMIMDTLNVPELKDRKVRQALNYAVDKDVIIKGVLNGMAVPLGISGPMHLRGTDQSIKPYPYNPEKAKALLKEAGYPNGFSLSLYSPSGRYPMDKEVVQAVADQLSKVGIKAEVRIMETGAYFKELAARTLKGIYFVGMGFTIWDPSSILEHIDPKSGVFCWYRDKALEEMVDKTRRIMEPDKRYDMIGKLQRTIHEEAVQLFLFDPMMIYGVSKKVSGFKARGDDQMDLWTVELAR